MNARDTSPNDIFRSRLARFAAALSATGFLSGLGFVPGCHRLFGFSGFFGLFGAAVIIEWLYRRRTAPNAGQRGVPGGRRNDHP